MTFTSLQEYSAEDSSVKKGKKGHPWGLLSNRALSPGTERTPAELAAFFFFGLLLFLKRLLFALKLLISIAHRRGKNCYLQTLDLLFQHGLGWEGRPNVAFI